MNKMLLFKPLVKNAVVIVLLQGLTLVSHAAVSEAVILDIVRSESFGFSEERKQELKPMYSDFMKLAGKSEQPMRLRWKSLMLASNVHPEKALNDLPQMANSNTWFVRNAALFAIHEIDKAAGQKMARQLISDKSLVVRSAAVDVLTKDLAMVDRDLLWSELGKNYNYRGEQSLWIRGQIVQQLSQKPKSEELKRFAKAIFEKDPDVRLAASVGLSKLSDVKFGHTEKAIKSWQEYVRRENLYTAR